MIVDTSVILAVFFKEKHYFTIISYGLNNISEAYLVVKPRLNSPSSTNMFAKSSFAIRKYYGEAS